MNDKISTEVESPALRKGVVTGSLPFVMFPDENKIPFWQDFSGWEGIPSDRRFYPKEEINGSIVFIADKYGILKNNKCNLSGEYGNGAIYVSTKDLASDIVEWCRANFL